MVSSCISVWAETNLVAYGNPPDDMAMRQLEYWSRPTTIAVAQCVLSKIHMEKWARHFGLPVTPKLRVVPLGVDTDLYRPDDRERPHRLEDALIIHAAPPGNRKKRPDVFTRMQDATLNDLGSRTMSQGTRDIFHSVRDYIAAAARELAEREMTAIANQITFHTAWVEDDETPANKKAEYKAALKALEKRKAMEAAELSWSGWTWAPPSTACAPWP